MAERRDPMFLIIAGAITALFLPFAIAFPPTLIAKLAAVALLVLIAAGISALVLKLRKKSGSGTD
jgi:predicted benzoate:H+ symporter BenE